jgi:hypothetical protein
MKPRNYIQLALLKSNRKAGKHEKPEKSKRRLEKVNIEKLIKKEDT